MSRLEEPPAVNSCQEDNMSFIPPDTFSLSTCQMLALKHSLGFRPFNRALLPLHQYNNYFCISKCKTPFSTSILDMAFTQTCWCSPGTFLGPNTQRLGALFPCPPPWTFVTFFPKLFTNIPPQQLLFHHPWTCSVLHTGSLSLSHIQDIHLKHKAARILWFFSLKFPMLFLSTLSFAVWAAPHISELSLRAMKPQYIH